MADKTLVAYYSMSGNSRRLASEIGRLTGAELEEIGEPAPRHGVRGMARALLDAIARRTPPILPPRHDPADYDLLVLGGPVWAGRLAAPVRSYARRHGAAAPRVAFFCTEGSGDAEAAFADLQALCRRAPEATLAVDAEHLPVIDHHAALIQFTSQLPQTRH